MAVQNSDNRFDWCSSLAYARRNYNKEECFSKLKNELKTLSGIDRKFLEVFLSKGINELKTYYYWFPYYQTCFTATYIWDTDESYESGDSIIHKTTTHTNRNTYTRGVFTGIYSGCAVDEFVGRNDQRFFVLNHVNDLDAPIYNDTCVYSSSSMASEVNHLARLNDPGTNSDITINTWYSDVFFIPIFRIDFMYNNKRYSAYINQHNCRVYYEYLVSEDAAKWATSGYKASVGLRITSLSLTILTAIISLLVWGSNHGFWKLLLLAGTMVGQILITVNIFNLGHNKQYFNNIYGSKGNIKAEAYKQEIIRTCFVLLIAILGILFISLL